MAERDLHIANVLTVLSGRGENENGRSGDGGAKCIEEKANVNTRLNGIFHADRIILDRPACVQQKRLWSASLP